MIDTLGQFEKNVSGLQPGLLLTAAIVTLAAGLFVFLGGLGFRKALFAVIGMYCGVACAIMIAGYNLMLALAFLGAGVLLAMWLEESFLVLITTIFAAVYGFSVLIRPYFNPSDELISIIRDLAIGVPYYNWPILLALIAAPVAVSSTFWRAASAVFCSAAATVLFLAGAIMLLKHTGFAAVGHINSRCELYLELFIAVTAIGAIVQYFILPKISSRFAAAKESVKAKAKRARKRKTSDSEVNSRSTAWRTS
jgi:hypothetical protein